MDWVLLYSVRDILCVGWIIIVVYLIYATVAGYDWCHLTWLALSLSVTVRDALEPRRISQSLRLSSIRVLTDTRAHTETRTTTELPPSCTLSASTYSLCTFCDLWLSLYLLSLWHFLVLWQQSSLKPKWQCSPGRKCFYLLLSH